MIRHALLGVALVLAVLGAGALPATAADPAPTPPGFTPPPLPDPSDPADQGPTYVITPGVGGSELPAPSAPRDVAKAREADRATAHPTHRNQAGPSRAGHPGPARAGASAGAGAGASAGTTGPQTPLVAAGSPAEVAPAVRAFAALVGMVVLFEVTAVRRRVLGRRRSAVTAG